MAFVYGDAAKFTLNSVDLSAFCDSVEISISGDTGETTTYGATGKTYLPGLTSWTVSISGKYDSTADTGPDDTIRDSLGSSVTFEAGPEGSGSGKPKYSGTVIPTGYSVSVPVGGIVTFQADFQGTGALTVGSYS